MFGGLKRGRFRSMASLILVVNVVGELNGKEHLRHRAVSLRQHGFLVSIGMESWYRGKAILLSIKLNY